MLLEILSGSAITIVVLFWANRLYFKGGVCKSKKRLDGKVAIITGANTGIGYETALDFAYRGAHVIMACRDSKKADQAAKEIIKLTNNMSVNVEYLDLADFETVRSFAQKMNESLSQLDILVNNAGVMQCPYWKSAQGFEMQLAVNHLDLLKKVEDARIITISSFAHKAGTINWNDINWQAKYSSIKAYYQTKLANILFTKELARRLKDSKVSAVAVNPGLVRTEILRHSNTQADIALSYIVMLCFPIYYTVSKRKCEGSQTTIFCALDDSITKNKGGYYSDCKLTNTSPNANSKEDAERLWNLSAEMVKL